MAQIPVGKRKERRSRRTRGRSPGERRRRRFDPSRRRVEIRGNAVGRCHTYLALGASPNFLPAFFMSASKLSRALAQILEFLIGTWQPPWPLHLFSPGASTFVLQPPRPAQSLLPAQVWALAVAQSPWPAQSFLPPWLWFLQVLRPRQMFGSCAINGLSESFLPPFSALSAARPRLAPATKPPRAAA